LLHHGQPLLHHGQQDNRLTWEKEKHVLQSRLIPTMMQCDS
jgi:hypothetical protein